jgi:acetoin utilization deacetylase AcuC-like enzyme
LIKIAFDPIYAHPLPAGHRFPMLKYELIPAQLLYEGSITQNHLFSPEEVQESYILLAHTAEYWQKLKEQTLSYHEIRRIGFPLSEQLIKRELMITQGSIDCALHALKYGCALNIAGGTHHAGSNWGEGFCLLNDQAIAAHYLLQHQHVKNILIIDLDVHQGNGTAEIFEQHLEVFTFSMHGANNFPYRKEKSDLDIALKDFTNDEEYLSILSKQLVKFKQEHSFDFIFYQAGVDVLETDKLGKLALSMEACKKRDELVLNFAKNNDIPIAISMGGGYSENIKHIVEAHCNTFRLAMELFE